MSAQWYDANISLPGCDKNMPGTVIAMARLNRPAIMVYGGTIKPGYSAMDGSVLDIISAFQSFGARRFAERIFCNNAIFIPSGCRGLLLPASSGS